MSDEPLDLEPIETRLRDLHPQVAQDRRALLAEVKRLRGQLADAWDEPWTAYVRGFGEHIGETLYETARLARDDSSPGERIYRITHVETVTPTQPEETP